MPKSKGAGCSTPTLNPMDKGKDDTLDSANDVGDIGGIFTRSRSRRLSITLPDHISPPKKARRSSISRKAPVVESPRSDCLLNDSKNQETKENSTSSVRKIADEKEIKTNIEGIAKVTPSPKKRKGEKKGISPLPIEKLKEMEDQELSSMKMENSLTKFCKENVQVSAVVGSPITKREKTRKSGNLGKIVEDEVMESVEEKVTSAMEPTKCTPKSNGIESNDNFQEAALKKEKSSKSQDISASEQTPKSKPNKLDSSSPEKLQKMSQPDPNKSGTSPVKLLNKKAALVSGATPEKLEPTSFLDESCHSVPKKPISPVKLSNKKVAIEDGSPLKQVDPTSQVGKLDKTPQPISIKLSATPKKLEPMSLEKLHKTPQPVLKKPATPAKVSNKKAIVEDDTDSDEDSDAESRKEIMRSAEKRIIRNLSTSESESRNHVKVLQLPVVGPKEALQVENSTDSDSAPEDITFDASRQSALELLKQTVDSIKRDKQKKKEKRKERLEILRQRKEEHLIRLKETKANRDDASCSSSEESLHEKNGQLKIGGPSQAKKTYFGDQANPPAVVKRLPTKFLDNLPDEKPSDDPSGTPNPKKAKVSSAKLNRRRNKPDKARMAKKVVHTLPVNGGMTRFNVVALNKVCHLQSVAKKAAEFKGRLLFGKSICRVPVTTQANNRKKLQANKK